VLKNDHVMLEKLEFFLLYKSLFILSINKIKNN